MYVWHPHGFVSYCPTMIIGRMAVNAEPQWREKKWPNDYAILTVKHKTRVFISANQTSERDPMRPTMDSRYLPMLSLTLWSAARAECIKRIETPLDDGPVNWARNLSVDVTCLHEGERHGALGYTRLLESLVSYQCICCMLRCTTVARYGTVAR